MSCAQVMYQPYVPYLSYDRSASATGDVADKKYRLHETPAVDGGAYTSSYLLLGRPAAYSSAIHHNAGGSAPAAGTSSSATPVPVATPSPVAGPSTGNNSGHQQQQQQQHHTQQQHGHMLSPKSSMASTSTANTSNSSVELKRDLSDSNDAEDAHKEAQYLSANCVLFMHYTGDAASVVDEHFTRALNQEAGYASDGKGVIMKTGNTTISMSQRSFPPSFWNSNYQAPKCNNGAGTSGSGAGSSSAAAGGSGANSSQVAALNYGAGGSHMSHGHASHHDIFSQAEAYHAHAAALHANHHAHHAAAHHAHLTHAQSDPWHYSLSSQAYSHNLTGAYPGVSGVSGSAVSRFAPQYGSFLLQSGHPSRLPTVTAVPSAATAAHCSVKAEPWPGRYGDPLPLPTDLTHPSIDASSYSSGHSYSNMAGLEAGQVQEPAKDLYWF